MINFYIVKLDWKNSKKRYNVNEDYRLIQRIRMRILTALKDKGKKIDHTMKLINCTTTELKEYLQQTAINNGYIDFDINNYSGKDFHIDHIVPCSKFNLKCSYHQKLCFNYNNLQVLTAKENLSKNDTYNEKE